MAVTATRARWGRSVAVAVAVLALLVGLVPIALRAVGRWLVLEEPLSRSRAIAVLGGHVPLRAMEAASFYHAGWAPEVWLLRQAGTLEDEALKDLGVAVPREDEVNRAVLERLHVPPLAIRVLDGGVRNTVDELRRVLREPPARGQDAVIVVTSKPHTRRVRLIWRVLAPPGAQPIIVRYARADEYDPDRWWRDSTAALAVSRELLGIANALLGFPVTPMSRDRPRSPTSPARRGLNRPAEFRSPPRVRRAKSRIGATVRYVSYCFPLGQVC